MTGNMDDEEGKSKRKYTSRVKRHEKTNNKFKKYIGNKTEGQGFADKRKKKVRYEYLKMLQKEKRKGQIGKPLIPEHRLDEEEEESGLHRKSKDKSPEKKPGHAFSKMEWKQKKDREEKQKKTQEAANRRKEREQALGQYQIKKKDNFKKLCKKTRKGQPVMKNQIEYLLQKIEKQVNQT